jgi:hypothetical protein
MLQPEGSALEQLTDSQLEAYYDKMREKGYNSEDEFADAIERGEVDLTEAEYQEEPSTEQSAGENKIETQEEGAGETVQEETKPADNQKGEAQQKATQEETKPVEDEKVDAQKYKTLQGILDARNREYNDLQAKLSHIEPYTRKLADPKFQQHVLNFDSVQQPIDSSKSDDDYMTVAEFKRLQQQEKQQAEMMQRVQKTAEYQQNFTRATVNNRNELINSGINPVDVDNAFNEFQKAFMSGNVYKLAHRAYNYDKAIEEAKKQGREQALKEIKEKGSASTPRTVKAQSTKIQQPADTQEEWADLGPAELTAYANSHDPIDPKNEKFYRWLEKKLKDKT